jgi:hypothetical protein
VASNVSRGAYYKGRTKKWLLARGWQVADLEVVHFVYPPGRKPFAVKRDQFGSDLLAVSRRRIVFVQVKGGLQAVGERAFAEAAREFNTFAFPPFVRLWIAAWAPGARFPRIIVVNYKEQHGQTSKARSEKTHRENPAAREGHARKGATAAAGRPDRGRTDRGARQDRLPLR